jgi:hypothetical protein
LKGLAGTIGRGEFARHAGAVHRWSLGQQPPCAFKVIVRRRHADVGRFESQLATVESYFYVARRR